MGDLSITYNGVTLSKPNGTILNTAGKVMATNLQVTANMDDYIPKNVTYNTQWLRRPKQTNGVPDITLQGTINTLRANRLAFLPGDQVIIEKTTDGGTTWVDAGYSDAVKLGLFSETRQAVNIPLLNGVKNINCGLRITFTAMKYNVPAGTPETEKYNYWNSNYVRSAERYNQLKEMYFWVSANSDTISIKLERATGANSTSWGTIFSNDSWGATGWSGNDYISFSQGVFGGSTNQTSNFWNYRLTFFTRGPGGGTTLATTYTTATQSIMEIRGYGDTWWTAGNNYAANDHLYSFDANKNATFPAQVKASSFSGSGAELTSLNATNISSGVLAVSYGGTGKTTAKEAGENFVKALGTTGTVTGGDHILVYNSGETPVFKEIQFYQIP